MLLAACVGDDPAPSPVTSDGQDAGDGGQTPGKDPGTTPDGGSQDAAPSCSQTTCGTSCVDLKTTPEHCGACDHTCGNGACADGVCQPVVVQNNITAPVAVTVSADSVFWLRDGAVERCGATACSSPTLITDAPKIGSNNPKGSIMVTDGAFVAWISSSSSNTALNVYACGVAGCNNGSPPKAAQNMTDVPTQLAVAGSNIYVTQAQGAARSAPIATLTTTGISGTANDIPSGVAADATNIYMAGAFGASDRGVGKCTVAGCAALSPLFSTPDGYRIALAGTTIVATSVSGIVSCPNADQAGGCGGASKPLADDADAIAIAGDATHAVWAVPGSTSSPTGSIRVCDLPDCAGGPRTIASKQPQPVSVYVDKGFVYWANKGVDGVVGSIWRAAL